MPGSLLVWNGQAAWPLASVTSALWAASVGAINALVGARSGPHVSGTALDWKSGRATWATDAQSLRTGGQLGRSPAVTLAVNAPGSGSGPSLNVAPPPSPLADTLTAYGNRDATCSTVAATVAAMLRIVPSTASVTVLIRPVTNA